MIEKCNFVIPLCDVRMLGKVGKVREFCPKWER